MRLATLIACGLLLAATPALAQQSAPAATPEQLAAARDEADRLIAAAQAGDVFENITDDRFPTVRHRQSGMRCLFEPGDPQNRLVALEGQLPRGDDAACNGRTGGIQMTLYATRYPERYSAEAIRDDAARAILDRFRGARPFTGDYVEVSTEGLPRQHVAAFEATVGGRPSLTVVHVAHHGDWSFKLRATGELERATEVGLVAGMTLNHVLLGVVRGEARD